jgi:hypothetical protein
MTNFAFIIPVAIFLIIGFVFFKVFGGVYKQAQNRKRLIREGNLTIAYVLGVAQTGVTVNQVPEMRLSLDIENVGGQPRRIEIKQLVDLGSIPRPGDRVYVLIDPRDPNNVVLSPMPFGNGMNATVVNASGQQTGSMDLGSSQMKDYMAMSPELRDRGKPGVATVVAVMPAGGRSSQIMLDIDNIGQPVKRVAITQIIDGDAPAVGTRLYFIYDPQNPTHMALSPGSLGGGQTLGNAPNRLDPLVLGPQLLQSGAKADGKVISAQSIPLNNPMLTEKGYSKWELVLSVKPQNGLAAPYQANLTISLSSKEKADKIAYPGAEVPLRYDPLDLQTISIDSIAMGYPDPYEAAVKAFSDQMSKPQ